MFFEWRSQEKWPYEFWLDTKRWIFNVFNFHLHNKIDKIVQIFSCCHSYWGARQMVHVYRQSRHVWIQMKKEYGWHFSLSCGLHRLLIIGLKNAEYLFVSIVTVSSIRKCHNDSHRHGTILKEVAIIFSFAIYNRFDCFWHDLTHEWFCHFAHDHIQECDWTCGHHYPLP